LSISSALVVLTHLISFLGFTTLCLTGHVHFLTIIAFYITLVVSYINDRYKKKMYFNQSISTMLAVSLFLYVILSVLYLEEEIFEGILKFLIFTQMIKHLGYKGMRDIIQIFILSFFQFLAGAIITIGIAYGFAFIIYIAVALMGLIVYNLRKESLEAQIDNDKNVINKSFLFSTIALTLGVFVISTLLFLGLPRLKPGFFSSEFIRPQVLKTGFSNQVKLGRVGEIKRDHSAVMRVSILNNDKNKIRNTLYWRGIALDHFDGVTWSVDSEIYGDYERNFRRDEYGIVNVKDSVKDIIAQEIITEPIDSEMLFAIDSPVSYSDVGRNIYGVNDSYFLPFKAKHRMKYRAYSVINSFSDQEMRNADDSYSYYIEKRYLQLLEVSEEIRTLAQEITRNNTNSYDKAKSIEGYLLEEMNYTLTLESGTKEFPLDQFLLEKKEGHCEYFATAMVVLLRLNGIPSRIVNGFVNGNWNIHGKFYLIRESDAHSWVEVYYPDLGWISFDPTPSASDVSDFQALSVFGAYLDYLKFRWQRYVIDFNQRDQIRLFNNAKNKITQKQFVVLNDIRSKIIVNKKLTATILILVVVFLILINSDKVRRSFKFNNRKEKAVTKIYNQALRYLYKKGYKRSESITPKEFADYLISRDDKFEIFKKITDKYMQIRYGNIQTKPDLENLKKEIYKLKQRI